MEQKPFKTNKVKYHSQKAHLLSFQVFLKGLKQWGLADLQRKGVLGITTEMYGGGSDKQRLLHPRTLIGNSSKEKHFYCTPVTGGQLLGNTLNKCSNYFL